MPYNLGKAAVFHARKLGSYGLSGAVLLAPPPFHSSYILSYIRPLNKRHT